MCQGEYFRELLVMMVSIQDPHRHLLLVSDQGDGYVDSFHFTRPFSTLRGLSSWAIDTPSHCVGINWSLATTRLEGRGPALGLHSNTSSSARHRIWCHRSPMHCMHEGCPTPRWTHLWYWWWVPKFLVVTAPGSVSGKLPSKWWGHPQIPLPSGRSICHKN